jgi:hypothetical protein
LGDEIDEILIGESFYLAGQEMRVHMTVFFLGKLEGIFTGNREVHSDSNLLMTVIADPREMTPHRNGVVVFMYKSEYLH